MKYVTARHDKCFNRARDTFDELSKGNLIILLIIFLFEGCRKPHPALAPCTGSHADYPGARPDNRVAVIWSRRPERSKSFVQGSVGVKPNKFLSTWCSALAALLS